MMTLQHQYKSGLKSHTKPKKKKGEKMIRKRDYPVLPARKLRGIAGGTFMGIPSTPQEINNSIEELKRRGLRRIL